MKRFAALVAFAIAVAVVTHLAMPPTENVQAINYKSWFVDTDVMTIDDFIVAPVPMASTFGPGPVVKAQFLLYLEDPAPIGQMPRPGPSVWLAENNDYDNYGTTATTMIEEGDPTGRAVIGYLLIRDAIRTPTRLHPRA